METTDVKKLDWYASGKSPGGEFCRGRAIIMPRLAPEAITELLIMPGPRYGLIYLN